MITQLIVGDAAEMFIRSMNAKMLLPLAPKHEAYGGLYALDSGLGFLVSINIRGKRPFVVMCGYGGSGEYDEKHARADYAALIAAFSEAVTLFSVGEKYLLDVFEHMGEKK